MHEWKRHRCIESCDFQKANRALEGCDIGEDFGGDGEECRQFLKETR